MTGRISRGLTVFLGVILVLAIVGLAYIAVAPVQTTKPYTALYALNEDGEANDYLTNLSVGESGTVSVVVENHEHSEQTYTVVASTSERTLSTETTTLEDGARWRHELGVTFDSPGEKQITVELYRGDEVATSAEPYRYITVSTEVDG